ncbi:MAG TPA: phosphoenolpyruvate-utilizing N-terminal domain-containing protein, partial [Geobacteraceae bacterium]
MALAKTERRIRGIGASPGIAIGMARVTDRSRVAVVEAAIAPESVAAEVARFRAALDTARGELLALKRQLAAEKGPEHLYVIDSHLLILDDAMLTDETVACISQQLLNAEAALKRTLHKFRDFFASIEDEYLRERV